MTLSPTRHRGGTGRSRGSTHDQVDFQMKRVSVLILTRNRLNSLKRTLDALLPQLCDGDEVVVLDTGSTDGTREHFRRWSNPHIRFHTHHTGGSWAEMRNHAVALAHCEALAFTDDDCVPAPDWMQRGRTALEDTDAVGGLACPWGLQGYPPWWHPDMGWLVGLSVPGHLGPDAGRIYYPSTSNLWVRRAVCRTIPFQEIGGHPGLSDGGHYDTGREDAQWWRRLRREGFRTRFDVRLIVGHAIDPARLDLAYLRRRARMDGRAWARREATAGDPGRVAYQWWRQLLLGLGAPWAETDSRAVHWHYHRLMCRRHGAALKACMAHRRFAGIWPALTASAALAWTAPRFTFDRAKSALRIALTPLWQARPQNKWLGPPVERVAILAFGFLGDAVILQSVLRGLFLQHPGLEIYALVSSSMAPALKPLPRLNLTPAPPTFPSRTREGGRWINRWLRQVGPDLILAPYLHGSLGRAAMAIRCPPLPFIGFDRDHGLPRRRHAERLSYQIFKDETAHEADNLAALLAAGGLPCEPVPPQLRPDPTALTAVTSHPWLSETTRLPPLVLFSPCAGYLQKEWTAEGWAGLAERVLIHTNWRIVLNMYGPRPDILEALPDSSTRLTILEGLSVEALLAWLWHCRAVVTVDSALQQLAHATEVPSVTLYGLTDERRWGDRWHRPIHRTVRACAADLTPDEKRDLPLNHELTLIQPAQVFAELNNAMSMGSRDHAV